MVLHTRVERLIARICDPQLALAFAEVRRPDGSASIDDLIELEQFRLSCLRVVADLMRITDYRAEFLGSTVHVRDQLRWAESVMRETRLAFDAIENGAEW